jgi:hypothetical protein
MLTSFTRWFLLWFLATVVLLCLGLGIRVAAATEKAGGTPAADRRLVLVAALQTAGPSLGDHAKVAGRLVGISHEAAGRSPTGAAILLARSAGIRDA